MDFRPVLYSQISGVTQAGAQEALAKLSTHLPTADIIVDIGSGCGEVSAMVADRIPYNRFIAVDIDPDMLAFHEANHPRKSTEYVEQDIGVPFESLDPTLQKLEGMVDLIWSNYSLQWIPSVNKGNAAQNIWRLLKPGGLAYLHIVHLPNKILDFCENLKVRNHLSVPTLEEQMSEWRRELAQAGFTSLYVTSSQMECEYGTPEKFRATRRLSKVYGVYLTDDVVCKDERTQLLESLEEPFLRTFGQPHNGALIQFDEITTYCYTLITIVATR